jgi:hypothetical protein
VLFVRYLPTFRKNFLSQPQGKSTWSHGLAGLLMDTSVSDDPVVCLEDKGPGAMVPLNLTPYIFVDRYQRFEGTCCVHLQGKVTWVMTLCILVDAYQRLA